MNRLKLLPPQTHHSIVPRERLLSRLDELFDSKHRLAVISAPAGFGKTTLAAEWARRQPNAAWLSLDVEDNDVMAFLQYLTEAMRGVNAEVGQDALEMIRSPQPPSHVVVLRALLYDLGRLSATLCVVMDDYQAIGTNPVRDLVHALVENMPPELRLVLISRTTPPINLRGLRQGERLIELKLEDLRFTPEEAGQFMRDAMGLSLGEAEMTQVYQQIDGWPAGLHMAALALQGREDVEGFLNRYSGSNYYIMDYLTDAVFERQDASVQNFLLKTCVLDAVSAPLASAMLQTRALNGLEGGAGEMPAGECQGVLEGMYRQDLLLTALDEDHAWFRYHPLFADLLRTRLHVIDHAAFRDLHLQAASWFQQSGRMIEAVNHAILAEDEAQVSLLFEHYAGALLAQGDLAALGRWMKMLTEHEIASRPRLTIAQAWLNVYAGRLGGLADLLEQAERLVAGEGSQDDRREMGAQILVIRAFMAVMTGNLQAAVKLSRAAGRQLNAGVSWVHAMHQWVTGTVARMQGRLKDSAVAFDEMREIGRAIDNMWTTVTAATEQGIVYAVQGDLRQARRIFEDGLRMAHTGRKQNFGCVSRLETALAGILYEQGHLEEALQLVEQAIDGNRFWKNPNNLLFAYSTSARIQLGSRSTVGARDTLHMADQELRGLPVMGVVSALLDAVRVQLWLAQGEHQQAADWVEANRRALFGGASRMQKKLGEYAEDVEINQVTAVRVLVAQKRFEEAFDLLDRMEASAGQGGRGRTLMHVHALRAAALAALRQEDAALHVLEKALRQASSQGYVRVFVDEGPLMEGLLKLAVEKDLEGSAYARKLLAVFAAPVPRLAVRHARRPRPENKPAQIEPLSRREKEVLSLIAAGLTNHQIALQLVISTGTVKAHSANIYRKLSAGNRVQAVERARALNLLA